MRKCIVAVVCLFAGVQAAEASNLLLNGNLDLVEMAEIEPGSFLSRPTDWQYAGSRANTGSFNAFLSAEPWAGPAPTPVTTDGLSIGSFPDAGAFWRPFTGDSTNGAVTGHMWQDVAGSAGMVYTLTGWAGAEPNALMGDAVFAIEFLDAANNVIGSKVLSLLPTLLVDNGLAFDYKEYTLSEVAPTGTVLVRSRISMIDATPNPFGGGQAFLVDDFSLTASVSVIPEPSTAALAMLGGAAVLFRRRR